MRHTKIICTMGPAVESYEKILELIDVGMNVARINFSHGTHQDHGRVVEKLKAARVERGVPLAIMADTKGPEIRLGVIKEGGFSVKAGQKILMVKDDIIGCKERVCLKPPEVLDAITPGMSVLLDDGYIVAKAVGVEGDGVWIEIHNDGIIHSQKSVTFPDAQTFIDLPAITEQDVKDIEFICSQDFDVIAASFVRSADHIFEIKKLLVGQGKSDIWVFAKIENSLGVKNFDSILQVADGIMVARGDLGMELPLEGVPRLQKMMIHKCCLMAKPVITATQMLESMIKYPRPTRAEVSDVANAIYDSSSSVMLSGETSIGEYPVEAVVMMKKIIDETEKDFAFRKFYSDQTGGSVDISTSVAAAAVQAAYNVDAKAIFAFTSSGATARLISRFRPQMPILALTPSLKAYHQMALLWGVVPLETKECKSFVDAVAFIAAFAQKMDIVQFGDLVVLTTGYPLFRMGTTNTMMIESVGSVIVRGIKGVGKKISGEVVVLYTKHHRFSVDKFYKKIVVLSHWDSKYVSILSDVAGIILQNYPEDIDSKKRVLKFAENAGVSAIVGANGTFGVFYDGQTITLDPEKGIVYAL